MPTASTRKRAFAIAAHPDDIEFYMAGTLLLLKARGWEIHYMTLGSGSCGSLTIPAARLRRIRRKESQKAARLLGAVYHPGIADDLQIIYDVSSLRKVAAVIRQVGPQIVFTHSPQDYMEDHTETCRLAVTAAFARGMPNFTTKPARKAVSGDIAIYHAMPHGLREPLRQRIVPELFVNTGPVHAKKREALAAHRSQKDWLDASQGMDSYLAAMDTLSLELGQMSGRYEHAEAWRRRLHLGFAASDHDPLLAELQPECYLNPDYLCRED